MPRAKRRVGFFTAKDVQRITGISAPMLNYLRQQGLLTPSCSPPPWPRGKIRYYAYRDLVFGRLIQRLRDTGIQLNKIKKVIEYCRTRDPWSRMGVEALKFLGTDGNEVFLKAEDGFLDQSDGQRTFAFSVNVERVCAEVIDLLEPEQRKGFTMAAPTADAIRLIYGKSK